MELKEYQFRVTERLEGFLSDLKACTEKNRIAMETLKAAGLEQELDDPVASNWKTTAHASNLPHKTYKDGVGRSIPNVCLKVPTGGGKTLLATYAIGQINNDYFERQTGFVLWIVPKDAIYQQTKNALTNRNHPYRQMLERISGGKVKILEKNSAFTKADTENYLCVMLLMLQSSNRHTKETLKMFQDSGRFIDFFPDADDAMAQRAMLDTIPNLDQYDLADTEFALSTGVLLKMSLGNVMRLLRPIVILDEGHIASSDLARETLSGFNPRFILELSATPNSRKRHSSNVLCDVSGKDLKDEEMITLPIMVEAHQKKHWKEVLEDALRELDSLDKDAKKNQAATNNYIRPIMLVRVDKTGKAQRDKDGIHAEEVREYLTGHAGLSPAAVRVKSATVDEIKGEDLLSPHCPVRVIISKDALKEGWDCPFAYSLVILSPTTAKTALTQYIGRILRQPYARRAQVESLNKCYVHCMEQRVGDVVKNIGLALNNEGLGDLSDQVMSKGGDDDTLFVQRTIPRRDIFTGRKIMMPRVQVRDGKIHRPIDYDQDILSMLNWENFKYEHAGTISIATNKAPGSQSFSVDLAPDLADTSIQTGAVEYEFDEETNVDRPYLIRQLMTVIPNPWHGARILDLTLKALRKRYTEDVIAKGQHILISHMKENLRGQIEAAAEKLFRERVTKNEIVFQLLGNKDDFFLADQLEATIADDTLPLFGFANQAKKTLFEFVFKGELNGFEENVALYMDNVDVVQWWHRIAVNRKSYSLQGWKRSKIYPDFLCCVEKDGGNTKLLVLETKGKHLDNDDTAFKRRVYEVLEKAYQSVGSVDLYDEQAEEIKFDILMQTDEENAWQPDLEKALT